MLYPRMYYTGEFTKFEPLFLSMGARRKRFDARQRIYDGYVTDTYYVVSGLSKICLHTDDGNELLINFLGPGSVWPLTFDLQRFTLEPQLVFEAVTPVEVLVIPTEMNKHIYETHPEFSIEAINHYCRWCNYLLVKNMLGKEDALRRISNILVIYDLYAPEKGIINLSHEELAMLANLSRTQVTKKLNELQDEGAISLDYRRIMIRDVTKLHKYCLDLLQPT